MLQGPSAPSASQQKAGSSNYGLEALPQVQGLHGIYVPDSTQYCSSSHALFLSKDGLTSCKASSLHVRAQKSSYTCDLEGKV